MASAAVALTSLSWRGHDIHIDAIYSQNVGGVYLWIASGLFDGVEVRGRDSTLIGVDGLFARNRRQSRRKIELKGRVRGTDAGDYVERRENLEDWFDYTVRGDLVAGLPDGRTATINALPLNILPDELTVREARLSIELESIAPGWAIA